ncbi:hypothetical protein I4F81_011807 [Pyropia yezoensis]|uniref:Uncharacterized protein n=1 Tax=Pyropia yezoensis TaxID=2788 RepID=A0ACC3CGC1_PYRYE|nr:hypothetical protein I4F81_011807 [Neopyropia yezoensis]
MVWSSSSPLPLPPSPPPPPRRPVAPPPLPSGDRFFVKRPWRTSAAALSLTLPPCLASFMPPRASRLLRTAGFPSLSFLPPLVPPLPHSLFTPLPHLPRRLPVVMLSPPRFCVPGAVCTLTSAPFLWVRGARLHKTGLDQVCWPRTSGPTGRWW